MNTDSLSLSQDIGLVHYIDDIMLVVPSEYEVATTLDFFVKHMHIREWGINSINIERISSSVKFIGVQGYG